jgi:hypothetical protein
VSYFKPVLDFIQSFGAIIFPVVTGGTFLGFLLSRLKRRDNIADRDFEDMQNTEFQRAVYELAYRNSANHGNQLAVLVIPAVTANESGDVPTARNFLTILGNMLGTRSNGVWTPNPPPRFVEDARDEITRVQRENRRQAVDIAPSTHA